MYNNFLKIFSLCYLNVLCYLKLISKTFTPFSSTAKSEREQNGIIKFLSCNTQNLKQRTLVNIILSMYAHR